MAFTPNINEGMVLSMTNLQSKIYTHFQEHNQFYYDTNSIQKIKEINAIRELQRNKHIEVTAHFIDCVYARVL